MPERRGPSPTLRRRRLSARLRQMREARGFAVAQVADRLEWSTAKIVWIEQGRGVKPNPRDVRDLCDIYEASDEQRDELLQLTREGRQRDWWHPYRKMLSERYSTYIGLEVEAATLLTFEPLTIPGLLQTDDYARALIQAGPAVIPAEEVERRVAVRAERQHILTADDPVRLWAVLDQAALSRPVGGPDVMRAQFERLVELAALPTVTIQVIPFDTGPHPGMGGPFTVLSFPAGDPDAVYVETIAGELLIEEDADVDRYREVFRRLNVMALGPEDTITMISELPRTR